MTTRVTVDVDLLRSEIKKTYTEVSTHPATDFIFPTGRVWAQHLGYPEPEHPEPAPRGYRVLAFTARERRPSLPETLSRAATA